MNTTSYDGSVVPRQYDEASSHRIPGMIGFYTPFANNDGYELGRRDGTMHGLVIGSVSGAIMMLVVSLIF